MLSALLRRVKRSQNVGSKSRNQEPDDSGRYVGSATCGQCHQQAYAQWQTSHHAMAMAEPTAKSVKANFGAESLRLADQEISFAESSGNFIIRLDGIDGALEAFRVAYTFGISHFSNTSLTWVAAVCRRSPSCGIPAMTVEVGIICSLKPLACRTMFCIGLAVAKTGITCVC